MLGTDRNPRVGHRRRYKTEQWWWVDPPDPTIQFGPRTRIESKKNREKGTVELAYKEWRVVRWDDKRDGRVGAREYIRAARLREIKPKGKT